MTVSLWQETENKKNWLGWQFSNKFNLKIQIVNVDFQGGLPPLEFTPHTKKGKLSCEYHKILWDPMSCISTSLQSYLSSQQA